MRCLVGLGRMLSRISAEAFGLDHVRLMANLVFRFGIAGKEAGSVSSLFCGRAGRGLARPGAAGHGLARQGSRAHLGN